MGHIRWWDSIAWTSFMLLLKRRKGIYIPSSFPGLWDLFSCKEACNIIKIIRRKLSQHSEEWVERFGKESIEGVGMGKGLWSPANRLSPLYKRRLKTKHWLSYSQENNCQRHTATSQWVLTYLSKNVLLEIVSLRADPGSGHKCNLSKMFTYL